MNDNMKISKKLGVLIILWQIIIYFLFYTMRDYTTFMFPIFWSFLHAINLLGLIIFSFSPSVKSKKIAHGRIIAIIPVYNEDSSVVRRTIDSLVNQSVIIDEIHVIDDGSDVPMKPYEHPRVFCHWQKNTGKRGAQVTVLNTIDPTRVDFIVTTDSDSVFKYDTTENFLRAMSNPKVKACTGTIFLTNFDKNILTALQEFNYGCGSVVAKCARKITGFLDTTSGACAMYRSEIIYFHLNDYLNSGTVSDDRRLCMYSLLEGSVLYVPEAVAYTLAPEKVSVLWKQRIRWSLGGWLNYPVLFANFSLKDLVFPIINLIASIVFLCIVGAVLIGQFSNTASFLYLLVFWINLIYIQALPYVLTRDGWTKKQKFIRWFFYSPLSIVFTLLISMPTKYCSLFKMRKIKWGTR